MNRSSRPKSFTRDKRATELGRRYGPWAVVTGASSGIGRELAAGLADAGLNLVLVARRQAVLEKLAGELADKYDVEARVIAADLALETGVAAVKSGTADLDVGLLIASAGFGTSGPFLDGSLAQELEMLDVNCRALFVLTHHFGRRFARRGRGGIVLMSSIVGLQGMPYAAHYAATKAYVQTLGEALHVELAPYGIDVLASAPGPVHSGFAERAGQRMGAAMAPADVVKPTLDALGRKATVLPGGLSKLLVYSLALLPRQLRVRIMGRVMAGMTRHRLRARVRAGEASS
jgi:short-subunit dehydrogenase